MKNTVNKEVLDMLKEITDIFNFTRLIMDDEARKEAGELVERARAVIAKAEATA